MKSVSDNVIKTLYLRNRRCIYLYAYSYPDINSLFLHTGKYECFHLTNSKLSKSYI